MKAELPRYNGTVERDPVIDARSSFDRHGLLLERNCMTSIDPNRQSLKWDVLTSKRPGLSRDLPPGKEDLMWVANSSTLIYGERDAILVDTFLTIEQSRALLDWVVRIGKNLTTIYLTHGHGDHVFGVAPLLERFPNARAVATPAVVETMREQMSPAWLEGFWRKLFPGQILEHLPIADALQENELYLEGHKLVALNAGKTDTAHSTCLHVPSVGLLVGGDAVYNGIHPYLAETNQESRLEWISTLDQLETLNPQAVVAGHKIPENADDPHIIAETRQYLRDFNGLNETTTSARELYDAMLQLHPNRANPGSLWGAAKVAKKSA
jgi:glyoxylase-like metal-dependent hydrolase (beta-lactamase superfamily II)